jgi:DNA processing protein
VKEPGAAERDADAPPADVEPALHACAPCRLRTALLAGLAGRLDHGPRDRQRLAELLTLTDDELVRAVGANAAQLTMEPSGTVHPGPSGVEPHPPRRRSPAPQPRDAPAICRHDRRYPGRLRELAAPPAMLHLGGETARALELLRAPAVALVGARVPTDYGRAVARDLATGLAVSGVCVVSGMAMGIDAEVHRAALDAGGPTLAVLAGGVDVAYPATARGLHRRLLADGAAVSEMPAGMAPRRWCFVARNRLVAALSAATVVIEARERSGTLITAGYARDLGRDVAAVPGPVGSDRSAGTNALIRDGSHLVRGAGDVLDLLYGVGAGPRPRAASAGIGAPLEALLARVRGGQDTPEALAAAGVDLDAALAGLTELELLGCVRRGLSGRYLPVVG